MGRFTIVLFRTLVAIGLSTTLLTSASANTPAMTPAIQAPPLIPAVSAEPSRAAIDEEVRAAKQWALLGVAVPAGAGVAFSLLTQPGGKMNVPDWQVGTLGGLFGFAGLWGVSMGYYRADRPVYATLSGLAKTAVLGGAIALERRMDCEQCDSPPLVGVAAIAGIVAWDVWDYLRLESSVRERTRTVRPRAVAPYLIPGSDRLVLGMATQF